MIDIKRLREDPEQYIKSLKGRGGDQGLIERFFSLDQKWRDNVKKLMN